METEAAAADVRQTLRSLVAQVLELDESEVVDDVDLSDDLAADSLQQLELVTALERKYGVRYAADDWRGPTTIAQLTEVTLARLRAA
jgi:acyl carrier protein